MSWHKNSTLHTKIATTFSIIFQQLPTIAGCARTHTWSHYIILANYLDLTTTTDSPL